MTKEKTPLRAILRHAVESAVETSQDGKASVAVVGRDLDAVRASVRPPTEPGGLDDITERLRRIAENLTFPLEANTLRLAAQHIEALEDQARQAAAEPDRDRREVQREPDSSDILDWLAAFRRDEVRLGFIPEARGIAVAEQTIRCLTAEVQAHVDEKNRAVDAAGNRETATLKLCASTGTLREAMDTARTHLLKLQAELLQRQPTDGFKAGVEAVAHAIETGEVMAPMAEDLLRDLVRSIRDLLKPGEEGPGPAIGQNPGIQEGAGYYPSGAVILLEENQRMVDGRVVDVPPLKPGETAQANEPLKLDPSAFLGTDEVDAYPEHEGNAFALAAKRLATRPPFVRTTSASGIRSTHTLATMEVSRDTWDEVHAKLLAADYHHALLDDGILDMTGIGLGLSDEDAAAMKRDAQRRIEAAKSRDEQNAQSVARASRCRSEHCTNRCMNWHAAHACMAPRFEGDGR